MNRKQFIFTLSVALLSGSMGGVLSIRFLMPPSVLAQDEPPKVIEAQEFRVVDEDGNVQLWLSAKHGPELHIFDRQSQLRVRLSLKTDGSPHMIFKGRTPQLALHDERAISRIALRMDRDEESGHTMPMLRIGDEQNRLRVVIGSGSRRSEIDSGLPYMYLLDAKGSMLAELSLSPIIRGLDEGWDYDNLEPSLILRDYEELGWTSLDPSSVRLSDLHTDYLGPEAELSVSPEGASLVLSDKRLKERAVLGTTELKNTRTGSTEIRAPSSLVLFDEEGKVVWSAP